MLDFLAAHPLVNVRVVLADHVIDLVENHVDVAIRIGRLPDSGLVATRVGSIHWVICASPDYLKSHGVPAKPEEFERAMTLNEVRYGTTSYCPEMPAVADLEPGTYYLSEVDSKYRSKYCFVEFNGK